MHQRNLGPIEKAARKRDRLLRQGRLKEAHDAFDGQIYRLFIEACAERYNPKGR